MPTLENYGSIANVMVTMDGETAPLKAWCAVLGLPYKTVAMRYKRGIREPERLFFRPHTEKGPNGHWLASLKDRDRQHKQQERRDFLNIFPADTASELQQVAALSGDPQTGQPMRIEDVIVTLVRDSLRRYWKLRENK